MLGVFYLGGLALYVNKIPERYNPGHYDILVNYNNFSVILINFGIYVS